MEVQPIPQQNEISRAISDTFAYIERTGMATYDPIDASGTPIAQRLTSDKSRILETEYTYDQPAGY